MAYDINKNYECGPMPNVMAALPNIGGALCSTLQSLDDEQILECRAVGPTYCCLTSFLPIVDTCLSREDIARQSCVMVPRWRFWRLFLLRFQRAACSMFQTCILNSNQGHTMCGSMADIQSATAEIRRGKKKRKKKKERRNHAQDENIMVCPIT